jgi:hypothetical protein
LHRDAANQRLHRLRKSLVIARARDVCAESVARSKGQHVCLVHDGAAFYKNFM